jgi:arginyl-tRNA synthetase
LYLELQQKVRQKFVQVVRELFALEIEPPALDFPPRPEMGDLSLAACFELARKLRQPPRKIAEQVAARLLPIEGVESVSLAGAGYVNLHLDRPTLAAALFRLRTFPPSAPPASKGKVLVEHTSINPNKAAHIGHLRNAVLGDTFVRLLRFRGRQVEVQNYVDNTGVQVADVVVGFTLLEKKTTADVETLIRDPAVRFDYLCWDLYARVFELYKDNKDALGLRTEALRSIEEGEGDTAALADLVSTAIVRLHLETMRRINVSYDLLVQESEILRLDFWKHAFELLKKNGALRHEQSGKNAGCWVMTLEDGDTNKIGPEEEEDVKIIVRSNGTVTYVGKDIAYHLWKFGLLDRDFGYKPSYSYADGHQAWRTTVEGDASAPAFGRASEAYAVIDTRQSYVQNVVHAAFLALGYREPAANLHHFAYEVVGLSLRCAQEMGLKLGEDDLRRSYVEVSGRKGLGIKADDLIDTLVKRALDEVRAREITLDPAEQDAYAHMIAVGALRYFLLKFSRRVIIAFDFKEALAFEGETGPYLQYSVVRARNIFRKFQETEFRAERPEALAATLSADRWRGYLAAEGGLPFWELVLLAAQLEVVVDQAITTTEPAVLAKYGFRLAQAFNNFYQRHHILSEPDAGRQKFLLFLVWMVERTLTRTVDLLGIEVPERM